MLQEAEPVSENCISLWAFSLPPYNLSAVKKLEISIKQLRLDLSQYFSFGNLHFQTSSFFYSAYFKVSWLIYQILKAFTDFAMYNIMLVNV